MLLLICAVGCEQQKPAPATAAPVAVPEPIFAESYTGSLAILPDPALQAQLQGVCADFLDGQYFDRLSVTLLIKEPDGTWRQAAVGDEQFWYPGCVVKLGCLPAIAHIARSSQSDITLDFWEQLDQAFIPSENEPFGEVLDVITQTTNFTPENSTGPEFRAWLENRFLFERYLSKAGLLRGQRFFNKTYPSNSGPYPTGAESIALTTLGANRLRTRDLAELMILLIEGKLEPASTPLFHHLLLRERRYNTSVLGYSLPPGTIYYSKMGSGRETIGDTAYITLPNGRTFVISVFANARQGDYTDDRHFSDMVVVAPLVELLIDRLQLYPEETQILLRSTDESVLAQGNWELSDHHPQFTTLYSVPSEAKNTMEFPFQITQPGTYEIEVSYADFPHGNPVVALQIGSTDPKTTADFMSTINFSRRGGRWYHLGNAAFIEGDYSATLSDYGAENRVYGVSAIRLRLIPENLP